MIKSFRDFCAESWNGYSHGGVDYYKTDIPAKYIGTLNVAVLRSTLTRLGWVLADNFPKEGSTLAIVADNDKRQARYEVRNGQFKLISVEWS